MTKFSFNPSLKYLFSPITSWNIYSMQKRKNMFNPFPPGGYSWEFLVGVCRPVLQILTLFQTKKYHFPYPFSDLFFRHKLCYHWLSLERKQNKSNPVRILFLSYLFGIETLNAFIYSRSSPENHTRFQTKVSKMYTIHPFYFIKVVGRFFPKFDAIWQKLYQLQFSNSSTAVLIKSLIGSGAKESFRSLPKVLRGLFCNFEYI